MLMQYQKLFTFSHDRKKLMPMPPMLVPIDYRQ